MAASSRALKLLSCHWGASCETKDEDAARRLGPYVRVHLKAGDSPCCCCMPYADPRVRISCLAQIATLVR